MHPAACPAAAFGAASVWWLGDTCFESLLTRPPALQSRVKKMPCMHASVDLTHGQAIRVSINVAVIWIIAQRCEAAIGRRRKSRMSAERMSMLKAQLLILYNPTCMNAWYID